MQGTVYNCWLLYSFHIQSPAGHPYLFVGSYDYRATELFGKIESMDRQGKAITHIRRGKDDYWQATAASPAHELHIAVCAPSGGTG